MKASDIIGVIFFLIFVFLLGIIFGGLIKFNFEKNKMKKLCPSEYIESVINNEYKCDIIRRVE